MGAFIADTFHLAEQDKGGDGSPQPMDATLKAHAAMKCYSGGSVKDHMAGGYNPDAQVKREESQQPRYHAFALQKAFPGVWIREDGAFRSEEFAVWWCPPDTAGSMCDTGESRGKHRGVNADFLNADDANYGVLVCESIDYKRQGTRLTLQQLNTLANYISEERIRRGR